MLLTFEPMSAASFHRWFESVVNEAWERAGEVRAALDFAAKELEFCEETDSYDQRYTREIRSGIEAWKELMDIAGFDLEGIFRRRALAPFVMIPRHVSGHYDASDPLSLMARLQQAQEAFVYGVSIRRIGNHAFHS